MELEYALQHVYAHAPPRNARVVDLPPHLLRSEENIKDFNRASIAVVVTFLHRLNELNKEGVRDLDAEFGDEGVVAAFVLREGETFRLPDRVRDAMDEMEFWQKQEVDWSYYSPAYARIDNEDVGVRRVAALHLRGMQTPRGSLVRQRPCGAKPFPDAN